MDIREELNPIAKFHSDSFYGNIYLIRESDLQWLLHCGREILAQDLRSHKSEEYMGEIKEQIQRVENCLELIDINKEKF